MGKLELTRINLDEQGVRLNEQYDAIKEEYSKTQQGERDLVQSMQDKYGVGTLNIESGTFIPSPNQPEKSATPETTTEDK